MDNNFHANKQNNTKAFSNPKNNRVLCFISWPCNVQSRPNSTERNNQLHLPCSPFWGFACTKHGVLSLASAGACQKLASHSCLTSCQDAKQLMSGGFILLVHSNNHSPVIQSSGVRPRAKVSWVCFARPNASVSSVSRTAEKSWTTAHLSTLNLPIRNI